MIRTQGEVEAAIGERISRFEQEFMGRGPRDIRTHLIGEVLLLTLAEAPQFREAKRK